MSIDHFGDANKKAGATTEESSAVAAPPRATKSADTRAEDHELDEIMAARKAIWGLGPIAIHRSGLRVHRMDVLIGTATVQPLNKKEGE